MNRYLALIFFSFFTVFTMPAQVLVSGKVIDQDGNPIAFANILIKGTSVGTYSNEHGVFSLKAPKLQSTLVVSTLGYTTKEVKLKGADIDNLVVVLSEGEELSEVVIMAKPAKRLSKNENPAYKILQKIWQNKANHGVKKFNYYQYTKYVSTEMGLSNIDSVFLKKAISDDKDYKEIRGTLSDKKYKDYFFVPMYLKEEVSKVYGNNIINTERVDIEAERSQGIYQSGFGLERITNTLAEYDIYDNNIIVLNKPFVSPISDNGYSHYSYVLNDSIERDNQKFYTIFFFPRQDQDLVFEGSFVVGDKSYAIESIEMRTTKKTNLNMVRSLSLQKSYKELENGEFVPYTDIMEGDFTLLTKDEGEKGMYVKKTISYSNYEFGKSFSENFYHDKVVRYRPKQFIKETTYWDSIPTIAPNKSKTQAIIGKISNNKSIKKVSGLIDFIASGYIGIADKVQLGRVYSAFSYNDVEKFRIRLGGRSFISSEDKFRTYFYGAYGFGDNKFKCGLSAKYLLFNHPRVVVGGAFQHDYMQLGNMLQNDESALDIKSAASFWFERGNNYYLTNSKRLQSMADLGLMGSNLHITLSTEYKRMNAADKEHFSINYINDKGQEVEMYSDANVKLSLTYTPKRKVYGYGVEQKYQPSGIYPEYAIKYTKGFSGVRNSAFDYNKIEGSVTYPVALWGFGLFRPTIEAGKTYGKVPLALMSPTPANQAYSTAKKTFALLDYYDFVTDAYVNLYAEHHFNGIILNRMPLVNKLKLREIVFAKSAYGTISDENISINRSNIIYNAPNKLYWEYGFGFSNIGVGNFRPIRLYFVWRGDFKNVNGTENPKFGIRVMMVPEF